jgi:hypothetical protein
MVEAEHRHRSMPRELPPKLASEDKALEWIAYRSTPLEWLDKTPQDEQAFFHFDRLVRATAEGELLAQLQAGKLASFKRSAGDPFAELEPVHPISWSGFRQWSQVPRPAQRMHRLNAQDTTPVGFVFFFDEAQLHRLWPAGKRLTLADEDQKNFVEAYAKNHPKMGADTLHGRLPLVIRKQIPRTPFRTLIQELTSEYGNLILFLWQLRSIASPKNGVNRADLGFLAKVPERAP